ncbi:hypothetical protein Pla110_33340 [Polystyrenella longa]|uniref:Ser-Thr-rich glycosyl-phosphatidyl-inositol-anchored membrane family protein n=1 Tax=Polystyrenella longa TaxID=2528007 RepID=A0A518CQT7_9PLAN|nr:hypothetical protein [Polystyrenella longa]QDU81592.1 hypothetical protein Pla110_33340 [Polystyrenella longa]
MQKLICPVISLCALWLVAGGSLQASETLFAKSNRFQIPYQYDAAEMQRMEAVEIQLHVSQDQGQTWQKSLSVSPETGRFDYKAPHDGEFWFSVKTLNRRQQLIPSEANTTPELKVIVDTEEPLLNLNLVQPQPGRVSLSWVANDSNLNAETLSLEYQQADSGGWQRVSVLPSPEGETSWSVSQGGVVAVRGKVNDEAGNSGSATAQVDIDRQQFGTRDEVSPPDFTKPIAEANPFSQNVSISKSFADPIPKTTPTPVQPQFVSQSQPAPVMPAPSAEGFPSVNGESPANANSANNNSAGAAVRTVNSLRFQVNYKVDEVGPSGVGHVEFFITENDGQKWYRYGEDPDHVSPFTVQVPKDGRYGFDLRARSGAGLAANPPQSGNKPPIVIVVDQTAPVIHMQPPQQGFSGALNQVVIRWQLEDQNPAEKPVALSYATTPQGPWQPIGGWQADQGSYLWDVNDNLPPKLYIRITARDAAGNLASAQTQQPLMIDLTRPSARIVNVESLPTGQEAANNSSVQPYNNGPGR